MRTDTDDSILGRIPLFRSKKPLGVSIRMREPAAPGMEKLQGVMLVSREHAPVSIGAAGVSAVVAASFARIFYRNAINTGLPIVVCPQAAEATRAGDRLRVDLGAGTVENLTQGKTFPAGPFPPFMQDLIARGGLMEYVKTQVGGRRG